MTTFPYEQEDYIFEESTTGSGTGNYLSFLRIQADGEETGYNANGNGQLEDQDGPWTDSPLIADLATIIVDGHEYYEVRLDLNETNSKDGPNITLEQFELWVGPAAGAGAFPTFTGLTNIF